MNMCSYNCCQLNSQEFKNIRNLSLLLKLISEENRLKLLCLLSKKEHCVCEILKSFKDLSQSLISHHLADLKEVGLISDRKDSRWVFYCLTEKGRNITKIIFSLKEEI